MQIQDAPKMDGQLYKITREIPKEIFNKYYPTYPKSYGEKVRKLRIERNLLIKDLAKKLKVSECTVINWEMRGILPRKENRKRLHKIFPQLMNV